MLLDALLDGGDVVLGLNLLKRGMSYLVLYSLRKGLSPAEALEHPGVTRARGAMRHIAAAIVTNFIIERFIKL